MPVINYLDLWNCMKYYYDMDLSMVWCRMEVEIINDKEFGPKTPIGKWKSAQEIRFTEDFLHKQMLNIKIQFGAQVVCGKVSRNLEVIDIDVKHWAGIDARYFSEVKALYPELFNRLRIHRTISGGYQIWYRCIEPINEGSKKLCRQKDNPEAGIETRGEGGLAVSPATPGYSVHQDRAIPTITREERDALIEIAKQFDEQVKPVVVKKEKKYDSVYSEDPFEHYNSAPEAEMILSNHGWPEHSDTSKYTYYTKPDAHGRKVSASWSKERRLYKFFATSSELYREKSYSPSRLLMEMEFNGDGKECFKFLIQAGYGKLQPKYEERMIKSYVQKDETELPANFSPEAKEKLKEERELFKKQYPHGIFWEYDPKNEFYTISMTLLIQVANELGIARYDNQLVHIDKNNMSSIDEAIAQHILSEYIKRGKDD
jgi:hypothetical protein